MDRHVEVLIAGAGPAGCAAARMLAAWGHQVILVDRPPGTRPALAESIPPSARRILSALAMANAVEAAGFQPWLGNTVWWGDAGPRVEAFRPGETGYQVERSRFDKVLRGEAARAGADVRTGTVRHVVVPGLESAGSAPASGADALATIDVDGQLTEIRASIVLDCSGRAGVIARHGLRDGGTSHRTVALAGVWQAGKTWPEAQDGHTLVVSHADGWAWSVPTDPETRYFTVMVDPERSHLARGVAAVDVYRAELDKVAPFRPWLEHATLVAGPWGADASLYSCRRQAGPGFLVVGDAASFVDPLSSFGVKKALASGWLAAVVVHTMFTTPAMAGEAMAFFERRERAIVDGLRKQTREFATGAAGAAEGAGHPFWEARTSSGPARVERQESLVEGEGPDPSALARDPDVLAALDDLRRRPEIRLRLSDQADIRKRAAIRGNLIVMDDHLFAPAWPGGLRYLRNIDLLTLVRLAPKHRDAGELYEALFQAHPGVSLPDFLGALSTLLARAVLEHKV